MTSSVQVRTASELTTRLQRAAQQLNQRVEQFGEAYIQCAAVLAEVHREKPWIALGFDSFDAYIDAHVPLLRRIKWERTQRQELVGLMTDQGMSTRAIGTTLGVSKTQVADDRASGVRNRTPEAKPRPAPEPEPVVNCGTGEIVDAEIVEEPEPIKPRPAIVGRDGKTYTPSQRIQHPPQQPPLDPEFARAVQALARAADLVVGLTDDVRFPANADQLAASYRDELINTIDALTGVLTRLPEPTPKG